MQNQNTKSERTVNYIITHQNAQSVKPQCSKGNCKTSGGSDGSADGDDNSDHHPVHRGGSKHHHGKGNRSEGIRGEGGRSEGGRNEGNRGDNCCFFSEYVTLVYRERIILKFCNRFNF